MNFAILAPVPRNHLESGLGVLAKLNYVSFGSQKWELFRKIETLRVSQAVPVLIYPSHENEVVKLTYQVSWTAWFVGSTEDAADKSYDESNGHRPETTLSDHSGGNDTDGWAAFWRVKDLCQLPEKSWVSIRELDSYASGYWRKNAAPRGPEIVARPAWI